MTDRIKYQPDILSCISNLSSDEVFTPPKIVNLMLDSLPKDTWSNENLKFLDPFSKSGVFLREVTKRLVKGLSVKFPNLDNRVEHILKNQIYGIGITELTTLISRRTVYCSKNANSSLSLFKFADIQGNIKSFESKHKWLKNGTCEFCFVNKDQYNRELDRESYAYSFIHEKDPSIFFNDMKFDVVIGNPPYQMSDGGAQSSAKPIYHLFVQNAIKLNPNYLIMIIPSRWFAGGKGLDKFRDTFLNDKRISQIHDFPNANDIFPSSIRIEGGVCYFLWEKNNSKKPIIFNYENGEEISKSQRDLIEPKSNTLIRYNQSVPILEKVKKNNEETFSNLVSVRQPFGLPTTFRSMENESFNKSVKLYANKRIGHIMRSQIIRNFKWVDKYKIFISMAYGYGGTHPYQVINAPIFGDKATACTETYLVIGPFDDKETTENVMHYLKTKFFRFMVFLNKPTQHATSKVYSLVPMQDFKIKWSDEMLYKKYNLNKNEINFIEKYVKEFE